MMATLLEGYNNKQRSKHKDHNPWTVDTVKIEVNGRTVGIDRVLNKAIPFDARVVVRGPQKARRDADDNQEAQHDGRNEVKKVLQRQPVLPEAEDEDNFDGEEEEEDDEMRETLATYERRIEQLDEALVEAWRTKASKNAVDTLEHKLRKYKKKRYKLRDRLDARQKKTALRNVVAGDSAGRKVPSDAASAVSSLTSEASSQPTTVYHQFYEDHPREPREASQWYKSVQLAAKTPARREVNFGDWTAGSVSIPKTPGNPRAPPLPPPPPPREKEEEEEEEDKTAPASEEMIVRDERKSEANVTASGAIVLDSTQWLKGFFEDDGTTPSRREILRNRFADVVHDVVRSKRGRDSPRNKKCAGWSAWRVRSSKNKTEERSEFVKARLRTLVCSRAWRGFEVRGGFVSPPAALECEPISALGETADGLRGTHRLTKPEVRQIFVRRVVDAYCDRVGDAAARGLRYVGLGSGLCLVDFEILATLASRGHPATSVVLADPLYGGVFEDAQDVDEPQKHRRLAALQEALDVAWSRDDASSKVATARNLLHRGDGLASGLTPRTAAAQVVVAAAESRARSWSQETPVLPSETDEATLKRCTQALKQLAEVLDCEQVRVLSSLEELEAAASERQELFGEATLVVTCDATRKRCLRAHDESEPLGCGMDKVHLLEATRAILDPAGPAVVATLEDTTPDARQRAVRLSCATVEAAIDDDDDDDEEEKTQTTTTTRATTAATEQRAMYEVERYWAEARVGTSETRVEIWRPDAVPEPISAAPRDAHLLADAAELRRAKARYWRNRVQRDELQDIEDRLWAQTTQPKARFLCVALENPSRAIAETPLAAVLFSKSGAHPTASPTLPADKMGSARPAELCRLDLAPAEAAVLPPLDDGTELVVEVPLDFQGGWANVAAGSYWWREALATLATLAADDAELRTAVAPVVADDATAWVRVQGPGCRRLKTVHKLGAIARRGLAIDSQFAAELSPDEIVEVLEERVTTCGQRLHRTKIATLLAHPKRPNGPAFGWVSTKTLVELDDVRTVPNFVPRNPALNDKPPPDGDKKPIPPVDRIPDATFKVPPGFAPGDDMDIQIPKLATEPANTNLTYTITVPKNTKPNGRFRVKMLSPMLDPAVNN